MRLSEILVSGAVGAWALAICVGAAGFAAGEFLSNAAQAGLRASGEGWHSIHRTGRHAGNWCKEGEARKFADAAPFAAAWLKLDGELSGELGRLFARADMEFEELRSSVCQNAEGLSAPQRLERLAKGLEASAAVVQKLQPQFAEMYRRLTAEQQDMVDRFTKRHWQEGNG